MHMMTSTNWIYIVGEIIIPKGVCKSCLSPIYVNLRMRQFETLTLDRYLS